MDAFAVTPHVVVFADLSPRAKVQYTRFLLENDVKFYQRASDKRFVANIRLAKPPKVTTSSDQSATNQDLDEEGDFSADPGPTDKRVAAVPEVLRAYANLIVLIGDRPTTSSENSATYVKEARLVRFINEVYDAQYEDLSVSSLSSCGSFAKFIRHHLTNRFGLKRLVDQQAWDLIEGLRALQHRVDVELFSCFLQDKYPEQTFAFFLFARSSLQRLVCAPAYRPMSVKTSSGSERKRKSASSTNSPLVWLSRLQAESLAETVFGAKVEDTYIEFMYAMKAFLSCDSSIVRVRTPARLLDANEFLFIATETYHKSSALFPSTAAQEFAIGEPPLASPRNQQRATPLTYDRSQPAYCRPAPPEPPSRTGAVVLDDSSDDDDDETQLQSRLGSLLERMKKRHQDSGP